MQKFISFIAAYSLVVSLLYLFGFWSSFNINVLEYITLSDVIKNAMYPLLYSSIFLFLGFVVGQFISVSLSKVMPPVGGADLPEAKYIPWFFILIAICASSYVLLFEVGNIRWLYIAFIVSIPLMIVIGNAEFANTYIPKKQVRIVVVYVLFVMLIISFGLGASNAEKSKNSLEVLKINGKIIEQNYIGWAGDFLFLWDKSENVVVAMSKSNIKSIEFSVSDEKPILSWPIIKK